MKQKSIYIILLILFLGISKTFSLSFNQVWNHSTQAGTATAEDWDATKVRNMAYGDGKLYLVYDHADIKVINATTGEFIKNLSKSGASGGTLTFCDVSYFDGKAVACNLGSDTSPLKIYVWDNGDDKAPSVALNTSNIGGTTRLGDVMEFTGNWNSGRVTFANDDGTTTRIVNYTISNGTINATPSVVNATKDGSRLACSSSIRVQPDATGYWINGKDNALTRLNTSGVYQYELPQTNKHGNGFSAFEYDGVQYAVATTFVSTTNYVGGAMQLYDATAGWANATVIGTYPSAGLGITPNTNCTGGCIGRAAGNYVEAWVLSTGQGIAYFKSPVSSNPVITTSPTSLSFGEVEANQTKSLTFSVSGQDISGNISVSSSNSTYFSVSPTSLSGSGGTVTVTFKPTAAQSYSATITVSATGATSKTVSVSGTGKITPLYPEVLTITELFKKTYTWNTGNKSRDIAYHNGKIYAIENNEASSAVHSIDGSTGTEITSEKVTNSWCNAFSVTNDGAGSLYVPTNNTGGGSNFVLSKLTLPSTVAKVDNHTNVGAGLRTDFIEAYKVEDNLTYIAGATVASSPRRVRVWSVNQSGSISTPKTFSFPSGDNDGTGGDVKWISSNKVLVTGAQKKPAILTLNMSNETFDKVEVNTTAASVGGAAYFTIQNIPFIVVPTNGTGQFKVLNIANPSNPVEVAANTEDIGTTANGGYHVGVEAVVNGDVVSIYIWAPNNGLGVWQLNFGSGDTPPDPDPDPDPDDPNQLQREMRAAWLATVWNIDWPHPATASVANQKAQLEAHLDALKEANVNAVFLQIRTMADRLYKETNMGSLVPWSQAISGTRGKDPGYDPLRFAIDEAHKRGIELHGWMNPYRSHASIVNVDESWILTVGAGKILNPGLPAVRQHIADVTLDVINNYPDIDGIIWDDYFYLQAITDSHDQTTYNTYPNGFSNRSDWRRDNVNKTVELVYNSIQDVNPGIRFGISPAGIWSTDPAVATKYGVTLPTGISGRDVYHAIYCDALAWLSQGTVDYISPQLYWATYPTGGTGQDYNVLAPWWQDKADKYGRHNYVSQGLYRFPSSTETNDGLNWPVEEIGRQIAKNREINKRSPGSIFYSTTNFYQKNFNTYVKNNYFQDPILPPAITWKEGSVKPSPVSNVVRNGNTLSWSSNLADGSYAIFAVPKGQGVINIKHCNYMIQRVWTDNNSVTSSSFASLASTHNFAVAAVNRYNMMSNPVFEAYLLQEEIDNISIKSSSDSQIINAASATITINSEPSDIVYYTTDNTNPKTSNTRKSYTSPFSIPIGNTIVRAYAIRDGEALPEVNKAFAVSTGTTQIWNRSHGNGNQQWTGSSWDATWDKVGLALTPDGTHFIRPSLAYNHIGSCRTSDENWNINTHANGGWAGYLNHTGASFTQDAGDVCVDANGAIYLSNIVGSDQLVVVKWEDKDKAPSTFITVSNHGGSATNHIGYGMDVFVDANGNGFLLMHKNGTADLKYWQISNHAVTSHTPSTITMTASPAYTDSYAKISIVDKDHFWIDGNVNLPAYCTITRASGSATYAVPTKVDVEYMSSTNPNAYINPEVGGATEFTYKGKRYGVFAVNNHNEVGVWSDMPQHYSIVQEFKEGETGATPTGPVVALFPLEGLGNQINTRHFVKSDVHIEDGKVSIYSLGGYNGVCAYEFSEAICDDLETIYHFGQYQKTVNKEDLGLAGNTNVEFSDDTSYGIGEHTLYMSVKGQPGRLTAKSTLINVGPYTWQGKNSVNWGSTNKDWKINEYELESYPEEAEEDVIIPASLPLGNKGYPILKTDVELNSLEIKNGGKLTIDTESSMKVNSITNSGGASGIVIKADKNKPTGTLIFKNNEQNPIQATVEVYSPASISSIGGTNQYHWQFFGIPFHQLDNIENVFAGAYVRRHNEAGWGTTQTPISQRRWIQLGSDDVMYPVTGYEITQADNKTYTFSGNLYNSSIDTTLTYTPQVNGVSGQYPGQHILTNPYMAAIPINAITFGSGTNEMDEAVYVYNTGSYQQWGSSESKLGANPGQYISIPSQTGGNGDIPDHIAPMQGFLVRVAPGKSARFQVDYDKLVKNTELQRAPKEPKPWFRLTLEAENSGDVMWLFEHPETTRGYDNGWDGRKMVGDAGTPMLFSHNETGNYQIKATDDIDNTDIAFRASNADTEYTITFNHGGGMMDNYKRIYFEDKETGKVVNIAEDGTTYTFSSDNESISSRFKITTGSSMKKDLYDVHVYTEGNKLYINNVSDTDSKVELIDLSGRKITTYHCKAGEMKVEQLTLQPGVYVVRSITSKVQSVKVVVR